MRWLSLYSAIFCLCFWCELFCSAATVAKPECAEQLVLSLQTHLNILWGNRACEPSTAFFPKWGINEEPQSVQRIPLGLEMGAAEGFWLSPKKLHLQ